MTFLDKLSHLRRRRGLSERALAKEVGFDQSAISRWRDRETKPGPELAKRLADYFGVPVETLLDDTRELPIDYDSFSASDVVQEAPPPVERLEKAIALLEQQTAAMRAERAALDEKIAKMDAALSMNPIVAEALAAGLTVEEIRTFIRAEIARRKKPKAQHPA